MERENSLREPKRGIVTICLIAVTVAVYFILEMLGDTENAAFMHQYGAVYPVSVYEDGEIWRLLTAVFLHFGFHHLLNNMVILACAGPILEDALGWIKYLLLYLLSGIGGNLLSVLEMYIGNDYAVAAGASGAIFGVIGGLLWVVIRNRGHYGGLTAKRLIFMIILCLIYGILTAGVDNFGHLGGLVAGFVLCMIFYRRK